MKGTMQLLILSLLLAVAAAGCRRTNATTAPNPLPNAAAPAAGDAGPGRRAPGSGAPAEPAAATRPPAEETVVLPAGTRLALVLDDAVGSDISRVEQIVHAHVARPVRIGGRVAVAEGSRVTGVVTAAARAGRVKGRARVAIRFDALEPPGGERYPIAAAPVSRVAPATKKRDAAEIGLPAAGGAIIGGLLGGKKGAVIGGAAGAGAGTAVVLSTRGKEVRLPRGTPLTIRLTRPLTIHSSG